MSDIDGIALGARGRLDRLREEIPAAAGQLAAFVVDNPGQVAVLCAATIVIAAAARNIVRPRSLVEVLALQAIVTASAPLIVGQAVNRGWLTFRVRGPATLEGKSLWAIRSRSSSPGSSLSA
jgi:hypothetical protein